MYHAERFYFLLSNINILSFEVSGPGMFAHAQRCCPKCLGSRYKFSESSVEQKFRLILTGFTVVQTSF